MPDHEIQSLVRDQSVTAGNSLAQAFFDDPLMMFMEPDDTKRLKFGQWFMTKGVELGRRWGAVYTNPDATGAAVWLTPGNTTISTWRVIRVGFMMLPFKVGFSGFNRFNALDSTTAKIHKEHMPGPHWYLLMLGVTPDLQGTGIGSSLIESGASQATEAGLPCYLETMTESNVEYYAKRNFEVVADFTIPKGGPRTWAMVRKP